MSLCWAAGRQEVELARDEGLSSSLGQEGQRAGHLEAGWDFGQLASVSQGPPLHLGMCVSSASSSCHRLHYMIPASPSAVMERRVTLAPCFASRLAAGSAGTGSSPRSLSHGMRRGDSQSVPVEWLIKASSDTVGEAGLVYVRHLLSYCIRSMPFWRKPSLDLFVLIQEAFFDVGFHVLGWRLLTPTQEQYKGPLLWACQISSVYK